MEERKNTQKRACGTHKERSLMKSIKLKWTELLNLKCNFMLLCYQSVKCWNHKTFSDTKWRGKFHSCQMSKYRKENNNGSTDKNSFWQKVRATIKVLVSIDIYVSLTIHTEKLSLDNFTHICGVPTICWVFYLLFSHSSVR